MKLTKILALTLAAVMCLFAFAACTEKTDNENEAATLKVATNAEFEPFEFKDADGNIVGFDVDLIKAIAELQSFSYEFSDMKFEAVLAAVSSEKCDIGLSGLTINETRKKAVDFTEPYYQVGQLLIVPANDTTFNGTTAEQLTEQLKNKKVGGCNGYTGLAFIQGDADFGYTAIEGLEAVGYDGAAAGVADLINGKLDAFILDAPVAKELVAENADAVKLIEIPLTFEEYALAVQKGNTELLDKLNAGLKTLKENGKLDEMIAKWDL